MKTAVTFFLACLTIAICPPAWAESLGQKIRRITGISATPSQPKAPGEEMESSGALWVVADPQAGTRRRVRDDFGFRSPIFAPNDQTILALRDGGVWRIDVETGKGGKIHSLREVTKLIGHDRDDPDKILVLRRENDVFLQQDDAEPINVSRSEGDNCGQPSLSGDGARVVFVRAVR